MHPKDMKERIVSLFDKSKFEEYTDIDPGIKELLQEINSYSHIMTLHSCEGHMMGEDSILKDTSSYYNSPYLCFLLDEVGWNIFWLECVPLLAYGDSEARVWVNDYEEKGTDYSMIGIYGPASQEQKETFWKRVKYVMKKLK